MQLFHCAFSVNHLSAYCLSLTHALDRPSNPHPLPSHLMPHHLQLLRMTHPHPSILHTPSIPHPPTPPTCLPPTPPTCLPLTLPLPHVYPSLSHSSHMSTPHSPTPPTCLPLTLPLILHGLPLCRLCWREISRRKLSTSLKRPWPSL